MLALCILKLSCQPLSKYISTVLSLLGLNSRETNLVGSLRSGTVNADTLFFAGLCSYYILYIAISSKECTGLIYSNPLKHVFLPLCRNFESSIKSSFWHEFKISLEAKPHTNMVFSSFLHFMHIICG